MLVESAEQLAGSAWPEPDAVCLRQWRPVGQAEGTATYVVVGDVLSAPVAAIDLPPGYAARSRMLPARTELRLLHVNDLHGHIVRLTPYGIQPVAARMAWYVNHLRQQRAPDQPEPIFLSAGDDSSGSVFDELIRSAPLGRRVHAAYRAYSALGLQAAAVGNHDLDFGATCLGQAARADATFPLLSANLRAQTLGDVLFPAAVFERAGVHVGVIGLTTAAQLRAQDGQTHIGDPLLALRHLLPALREICDVIVVLSHLGLNRRSSAAAVSPIGDEELAWSLAPGDIDLIIGGHTHHTLNEEHLDAVNIMNGTPVVQAGANGRYLGEVSLAVERVPVAAGGEGTPAARPLVSITDARLLAVADLPSDPEFEARIVQPLYERVRPGMARVIGMTDMNDDLSSQGLRARFDRGESALANYVTEALHEQCHRNGYPVDLAMIDASILRRGVPIGAPLTIGDWYQVMPYSDSIQIYLLSGHELLRLLADNALRLGHVGEPRIERGFVQFGKQLRYTIERGASRRDNIVTAALLRGFVLRERPDHRFYVACHSHFRQGARVWERQAWPRLDAPPVNPQTWRVTGTNLFLRDEIIAYIAEHGGMTAAAGARHDGRLVIEQTQSPHEHRSLLHQSAVS